MPLKLTRREGSSVWWITGTFDGRRIRKSTGRADRRAAEDILRQEEQVRHRAAVFGEEAVVGFGDAVASYIEVQPPRLGTKVLLERLVRHFGKTLLKDIDQAALDRAIRVLCQADAAPATKQRNVIVPLQAVLNHAARRGWCKPPAFEKPKGASGIKRTRWLTPAEWSALEAKAAPHLRPLLVFLIGTGTRLSEALELEWSAVNLTHAQAVVWQKQGNERTLNLPPPVVVAMGNLAYVQRDEKTGRVVLDPETKRPRIVAERVGRVFRTDDGLPYRDTQRTSGGQIKGAFGGACRRAGLQDVTPHTLRHTWASWQYALHRDPMQLRDDGGWANLSQVERYAKLVPKTMVPEIEAALGLAGTAQTRIA